MSDRARQFLPFDALRGFKDEIKKRERIVVPFREIAEDRAEVLSRKMNMVKKNMMVKIKYFCDGEYLLKEGIVSIISQTERYIMVVKTKIMFKDVYEIDSDEFKENFDD